MDIFLELVFSKMLTKAFSTTFSVQQTRNVLKNMLKSHSDSIPAAAAVKDAQGNFPLHLAVG